MNVAYSVQRKRESLTPGLLTPCSGLENVRLHKSNNVMNTLLSKLTCTKMESCYIKYDKY
ncbi:hypothetical protein L9F63_012030, partial [Diploptera punctata]